MEYLQLSLKIHDDKDKKVGLTTTFPQRIHGRDEFKARVTNDIPLNNIEVYVIKLNIWLP